MKKINYFITLLGWISTFFISIYAAHPWGDNCTYQDIFVYLILAVGEIWIASPFILLYFLNRKFGSSSIPKKILLFSALVVCAFGNYIYIDSIFIHTSSTSALIFIFLPLYELVFLAVISAICVAKYKGT